MRRHPATWALLLIASVSPAMASPAAPSDSLSHAETPGILILSLDRSEEVVAIRVKPGGLGYVTAIRPDGKTVHIPVHRIRSIRDLEGHDWTREVVVRGKEVSSVDGKLVRAPRPPLTGGAHDKGWFPVFHFGLAARVDAGSPLYQKGSVYALADLGAMRRVGKIVALGAGLYMGGDDYRLRFGPKARLALWAGRDVSLELAPGLLVAGDEDWGGEVDYPGGVVELNLNVQRSFLFTVEVERVKISKNGAVDTDTSWYVGGKVAGLPGLIGMTAGVIVLALLHTSIGVSLM